MVFACGVWEVGGGTCLAFGRHPDGTRRTFAWHRKAIRRVLEGCQVCGKGIRIVLEMALEQYPTGIRRVLGIASGAYQNGIRNVPAGL